jgi:acylglycerol lipase
MNPEPQDTELAFSRPVDEPTRPQRQILVLRDGYQTPVYVYGPPGAGSGIPVLYLHGIQSHPGWFVGSCAHLASLGHRVFAVCRRGSGDNARHRGHAASAGQLLDDMETAARYVLDATRQDRLALVGVSWGGKLAACYAASPQRTVALASLVLVAPGIVPRVDVGVVTKLGIGLALLVAPQRRFDIPLNEPELFTDNLVMRDYLRADRHRLMRATARFFYSSSQLDGVLRGAGAVQVPTTLILAERDRIIDNAHTRRVVDRLTAGSAQTSTLPGSHTLEFEQDPTRFYQTLAAAVRRADEAAR